MCPRFLIRHVCVQAQMLMREWESCPILHSISFNTLDQLTKKFVVAGSKHLAVQFLKKIYHHEIMYACMY